MDGIERIKILASQVTNKCVLKIVNYLISREDMNDKYLNEEKNLTQMIDFIKQQAKKKSESGIAIVDDEEVFGWAIHYFDETNIDLKISESSDKKEKEKPNLKLNTQKNVRKSNWHPEGQLTLF